MAHDVAKAMSYLHEKGIVHCSTSPQASTPVLHANTNTLPCVASSTIRLGAQEHFGAHHSAKFERASIWVVRAYAIRVVSCCVLCSQLDSKYRALLCGFSLARFVNRQADGSKAATTELAEPFRQPQSTILFSAPEVWNVHLRPGGLRPDATDAAQREETRVTSGCQDHGYASDVYRYAHILSTADAGVRPINH